MEEEMLNGEDFEEKRKPCSIFGEEIGTSTGWDQANDWAIMLYKFIPNDRGKELIKFDFSTVEGKDIWFCIDYETGVTSLGDDDVEIYSGKLKLSI